MDELRHKEFPKYTTIIVAIFLGAMVGVGVYQAAQKGLLPLNGNLPSLGPLQTQRTQTVVNEESSVIDAVEKSSPSVVAIAATRKTFNPLDPFSIPKNQSSTIGTGFVVSEKGIIITNKHVISDESTKYKVITRDGKQFEVRKIYKDPVLDLGIVQIDEGGLTALELGDSSKIKVGQTTIAIGNALGRFTNTVTTGVVSGVGRRVVAGDPFSGSAESLDDLIQTDAAINPGNSGGPLLNSAGQVIGVNVATTEGAQNIGFAIPINAAKDIVDQFVTNGTVSRPFLGVKYTFVSKDVAILNEVPQGAYVQEVVPSSAADKAGLEQGDIITKIDGVAVTEEGKISSTIAAKKVGDSLSLTIYRDGKEMNLNTTLQDLPSQ